MFGSSRHVLYFLLCIALVQFFRNKAFMSDQDNDTKRLYLDLSLSVVLTSLSFMFIGLFDFGETHWYSHSGGSIGLWVNKTLSDYIWHPLFGVISFGIIASFLNVSYSGMFLFVTDFIDIIINRIKSKLGFKDDLQCDVGYDFDEVTYGDSNVIVYHEKPCSPPKLTSEKDVVVVEDIVENKHPLAIALKQSLNAMKISKNNDITVLDDVVRGAMVSTIEMKLPVSLSVEELDKTGRLRDLTRRLKVESIRLVYMIKGTDSVFVEIPNDKFDDIPFFKTLAEAIDKNDISKFNLPILLGVSTSNKTMMFDLASFPHMLVAGTSNSGKTVGVHGIVCSLMVLKPNDVEFIFIDPKLNEFGVYENSPYLFDVQKPFEMAYMELDELRGELIERIRSSDSIAFETLSDAPVSTIGDDEDVPVETYNSRYFVGYDDFQVNDGIVTDMEVSSDILKRLTVLMDVRSARMSVLKVPNIVEYNKRHKELNGEFKFDKTGKTYKFDKMKYVVLVIDEMADLMMMYGKDVELHIKRLAQKARSTGIHLIFATQRPSVDIISGAIKANLQARLSYRLATEVDSRTVGVNEAYKLLGRGDCLFSNASVTNQRMHSCFISMDDIHLCSHPEKNKTVDGEVVATNIEEVELG